MLPWWLASLIANVSIAVIEFINTRSGASANGLLATFSRTWPLMVTAQVCLYYAYSGARSWLIAWTWYALGSHFTRLLAVAMFAGGEVRDWYAVTCGAALMLGGSFLVKWGVHA